MVKANAYGHWDLIITKKLMELGIEDFAVATVDEGIRLGKHQIKGNILILGFYWKCLKLKSWYLFL